MPTVDIPKTYDDGQDLTESQLDSSFEYLETLLNTTKLDYQNIQSGGVIADNLGAGSVTESKLGASAVTAAKIADSAVTTQKVADLGVTTAKLADTAVTTGKINDAAVTTAKINDGAVTQAKRAALGQQISATSGAGFTTGSTSLTDVTNLSVSITTTGRPVLLLVQPDGGSAVPAFCTTSNSVLMSVAFVRDATTIAVLGQQSVNTFAPPIYVDVPSAGTYTYKVQIKTASGATPAAATNVKLVAFEL